MRLLRAGRDPGADAACRDAVRAFEASHTAPSEIGSALGPAGADMAAECAVRAIDRKIAAEFQGVGEPWPRPYRGTAAQVLSEYEAELGRAARLAEELEAVAQSFGAPTWTIAARERQASLYDGSWRKLYGARLSIDPALDRNCTVSDDPAGNERLRYCTKEHRRRHERWRDGRDRRLAKLVPVVVRLDVETVISARALGLPSPGMRCGASGVCSRW